MKKLIVSLVFFALTCPLFLACTTTTHYDSVSTEISLYMDDIPKDGTSMTVHQRFQFDRDLLSLSMMSLEEAWLVKPVSDNVQSEEAARLEEADISLDFVKWITIKLVTPEDETVDWLMIPASRLHGENAVFTEFDVGDLRDYLDDLGQLELSIDIAVEPYHAMQYWRDVCEMNETCVVYLPLSMQFKMEE